MLKFIFCILSACIALHTAAQEHLFSNFGKDYNVPSAECYNVFQDSKGYIWFGSEAGLCRYNGAGLKIYNADKGFAEKVCYGICETPAHDLYFVSSKNRILRYEQAADTFIEASFSKALKPMLRNEQLYFIKAADDSTLITCSQWLSFNININTGQVKRKEPAGKEAFSFTKYSQALLPLKNKSNNFPPSVLKNNNLQISIGGQQNRFAVIPWTGSWVPQWLCHTAVNKRGDCFISLNNMIIKVAADGACSYYTSKNNLLNIYIDTDGDLWAGTLKGGLLLFSNGDIEKLPVISLPGVSVLGICVDYEGGIWCSSLEKGMFYSKSKYITSYKNLYEANQTEDLLKSMGDEVICHIGNRTILKIRKGKVLDIPFTVKGGYGLSDMVEYKNGYVFCSHQCIGYVGKDFRNLKYLKRKNDSRFVGASDLSVSASGRLFLIHGASVSELVNNAYVEVMPNDLPSPANCLLALSDQLLVGCKDGLYKVDLNSYRYKKIAAVSGSISDIIRMPDGSIYASVKDGAIYKYVNGQLIQLPINLPKDLMIFDLCASGNNALWAGTNKGALKMDVSQTGKWILISAKNGLPSSQVNKVVNCKGDILVSTSEGLCLFTESKLPLNTAEPRFYFRRATINDKVISGDTAFHVPHNYYALQLHFNVLLFKSPERSRLVYRLYNKNNGVAITDTVKGTDIDLPGLKPGNYVIEVRALNDNDVLSQGAYTSRIVVEAAFYETWWFYVLVILLLAAIVFITAKYTSQRIQKKEEEKTRINKLIAEYQMTALQAQMNPHFVFNAINSIQGYILNSDVQQAYDYLAKFSRLIRMVLNNSQEKTIVLQQEIEMIELYVELEKLRFNHRFDFELSIDPEVNLYDFQVPTMLIQPYIENAIWHGLMNLPEEKKGVLKVSFSYHHDALLISIEDNGIGREAAKEYSQLKNHKSVGMKLTEQRLTVINRIQRFEKAKVLVTDLYTGGTAAGTKVEIIIPLN